MEITDIALDHRSADLSCPDDPPSDGVLETVCIRGYMGSLSLARRLENVFMVGAMIRKGSMFHPVNEREILAVRDLAIEAGIGMAVRKAGRQVHKVFLFGPEKEAMAVKIPDIDESMGDREFIVAQIAIANMAGAFLDFPRCCRKSFVEHLMACTDQDAEATRQLREYGDPDPRAYFVERFVPCRPDCTEAIREGRRIEEALKGISPCLLELYEGLRRDHVEEVRSGRILDEKRARDRSIYGIL